MNETFAAVAFVRHPGRRGIQWLRGAWKMFTAARMQWLTLLLAYDLFQICVSYIPFVGPLAFILLRPVFTVGFLAAAWTQERGGMPELRHLLRGFGANLRALIPIGAFLVVGTTIAVLASAIVDGGALVETLTTNKLDDDAIASGQIELGMLVAIALALPVASAVWFAPALVVFNSCGAGSALATSLRAVMANWKPMLVYALSVSLYGAFLPLLAVTLITSMLPPVAARIVVALTVVPYVFVFIAVQTISDYVSYRDIFHADKSSDTAHPPAPAAD